MKNKKIAAAILSTALAITSVSMPAAVFSAPGRGVVEAYAASTPTSGTCGANLTWTLDSEGTLTISGTGAMTDFEVSWNASESRVDSNVPWLHNDIKKVIINNGVTTIGKQAFEAFTNIVSVALPDSITSINDWAFSDCRNLKTINLSDNVKIGEGVFYNTAWLEIQRMKNPLVIRDNVLIDAKDCHGDVVIPEGVTRVDAYTFRDCTDVYSVTVPERVTEIGMYAMNNNNCIRKVIILNKNCKIFENVDATYQNAISCDIIYGYTGSTAEAFAEKYDKMFIPIDVYGYPDKSSGSTVSTHETNESLGDANGDGKINAADATKILVLYASINAGEAEVTDEDMAVCDVNGDGMLNAVDASLVLAFYADLAKDPTLTLEAFLDAKKNLT